MPNFTLKHNKPTNRNTFYMIMRENTHPETVSEERHSGCFEKNRRKISDHFKTGYEK